VMIDEISSTNGLIIGTDNTITESIANSEDEDTWSFDTNRLKTNETMQEKPIVKPIIAHQFDDSDDDGDEVEVIIRNYESETSNFQTNREKARGILSGGSTAIPPKVSAVRGVDCDAQGVINGQPTCEYDIMNGDKPWKKPGLMFFLFTFIPYRCFYHMTDSPYHIIAEAQKGKTIVLRRLYLRNEKKIYL
ncbi:unnamed protein product, partial [Rotaria magnacalcarata]